MVIQQLEEGREGPQPFPRQQLEGGVGPLELVALGLQALQVLQHGLGLLGVQPQQGEGPAQPLQHHRPAADLRGGEPPGIAHQVGVHVLEGPGDLQHPVGVHAGLVGKGVVPHVGHVVRQVQVGDGGHLLGPVGQQLQPLLGDTGDAQLHL